MVLGNNVPRRDSLFSHVPNFFIRKARHLENVRKEFEKKGKQDEYSEQGERRKTSGDATNAEIFPLKHLVCQLSTEEGSHDVTIFKARLSEFNIHKSKRHVLPSAGNLLWKIHIAYMIIP